MSWQGLCVPGHQNGLEQFSLLQQSCRPGRGQVGADSGPQRHDFWSSVRLGPNLTSWGAKRLNSHGLGEWAGDCCQGYPQATGPHGSPCLGTSQAASVLLACVPGLHSGLQPWLGLALGVG